MNGPEIVLAGGGGGQDSGSEFLLGKHVPAHGGRGRSLGLVCGLAQAFWGSFIAFPLQLLLETGAPAAGKPIVSQNPLQAYFSCTEEAAVSYRV